MINNIAHLADIHLMNKISNQDEQNLVVNNLINKLREVNPDMIVIVGDLFHDFISISNETKVLASHLLNELSLIAKVVITSGNHDRLKRNDRRLDSIKALLKVMQNKKIDYLDTTDFYNYGNVTFAVWHHPDKMSPWVKHPDYIRQSDSIYIDLFHDPVQGCKSENGTTLNDSHYVNMNAFKGDIVMAGDIHLHNITYVNDKPFFAYPSSLYETKYNEGNGAFHGFILWSGFSNNDIKAEPIRIDNDYAHHEVIIGENYNYENIEFTFTPSKYNRVKIKWSDYESSMNKTNEVKIRKALKDKYGDSIIEVKWDKKSINKNDVLKVDDNVLNNITSLDVQNTAIREYLTNVLKYDDQSIIEDVIKINNIIEERIIKNDDNNYNISLLKLKINNFRSYGDDIELNVEDINGLTQIFGSNRAGKTTLMYSFLYVVFGIIESSKKREKNSDLRFINNKRELDFCDVEATFRINDLNVLIERRTERKWNRNKTEVTACPTTLNFYTLDDNYNKVDNETDEQKKHTQKVIETAFGEYDDFIRKYYIDSDNLNKILSTDRAVFIDNILADSGLGIFDDKLAEFKTYRSELNKTRNKIVLDVQKTEAEISEHEINIDVIKSDIENNNGVIVSLEKEIIIFDNEKQSKLSMLRDIKPELLMFDRPKKLAERESIQSQINKLNETKDILINEANKIEVVYSDDLLNEVRVEIDSIIKDKNDINTDIQSINSSIAECRNRENAVRAEISGIEMRIKTLNNDSVSHIEKVKANINNGNTKISMYLSNIDDKIVDKNKSIDDIRKQKVCITCGQDINDPATLQNIENRIVEIQNEISELERSKTESDYILKANAAMDKLRMELENSETVAKYNDEISLKMKEKISLEEKLNGIKDEIIGFNSKVSTERERYDNLELLYKEKKVRENDLLILKQKLQKKDDLIKESNLIPDKIKIHELNIQIIDKEISDYEDSISVIESNKLINNEVESINIKLAELKKQIVLVNQKNTANEIEIKSINTNIDELRSKIKLFNEQERIDIIENLYLKCVSRDGIPTQLLLKMIPVINDELGKMLENIPFKIWFDDNINLQMMSLVSNAKQSVLDGSGMERTFIAFCLKVALVKINNRHVYDVMFIDEITSKLDAEYVEVFKDLLNVTKDRIGKVFIIDHYNTYDYDNSLTVISDENEVSHLELNN